MSTSTTNILAAGYKGKVGNQYVMKTVNGKSVIAAKPKRKDKLAIGGQLKTRNRFKAASDYAKLSMDDPETLEYYQNAAKPGQNAYTAAVTDFLRPPWINCIETTSYKGKPGDKIQIEAADNYKVARIAVTITDPDGQVIEEGDAQLEVNKWFYTATASNQTLPGSSIIVTVFDMPGHPITETYPL